MDNVVMILKIIFWSGFLILLYHVFLYGIILWAWSKIRKQRIGPIQVADDDSLPSITVVCAAYNEEASIEEKIKSFLALDYPKDKIKMLIVSDDSSDNTNTIVSKYTEFNVDLVIQKPRGGKQKAHNLVQPFIYTDYILSTDANSIFAPDSVKLLVRKMKSDESIGIVSGELILIKKNEKDSGEGLYWKYECFLKQQDSNFASIVGSNGSIFLIRRELFTQIHPNSCDDFERTLFVLSKGVKAKYERKALVTEEVTEYAREEIKRKIRIITTEWYALKRNIGLLNPFKFGKISLVLFSHKIIRWLFFLFMLMMLVSSALIADRFYQWIFLLQLFIYWIGILELTLQKSGRHIPGMGIFAYITAMGWASMIAFFKFLFNADMGIWNPVRKKA
jgi:poly-beta-1,6-N-acetyl-D-glucosamine synthase